MPVVLRSDGAFSTERSRLPQSRLRRVTVLRRVVHKIARSGVAARHVGVQRPDYDVGSAEQGVTHSRFEAVIGVNEGTRPSRAVYAGLILAVLVPVSACSSPSATQSPTVPTSTSASSPSTPSPSADPTASASSAALASYTAFWDAKVASQAKPAQGPPAALARAASGCAQPSRAGRFAAEPARFRGPVHGGWAWICLICVMLDITPVTRYMTA